jgi:uncharacterized protein
MNRNIFKRAALAVAICFCASLARGQQPSSPPAGSSPSAPTPTPAQPPAAPGKPAAGAPAAGAAKESNGPKGASTAQPGPAAQDLARTMVSEKSWTAMIDGYAEALSTQISRALQARGEKPADDLEKRVRSQLAGALDHKEGLQLEATELAARFSEQELKAISTFYRSPAGQKLLKELPEMSASVDARIRERLTAAVPKIVQEVAPSLAESLAPGGGAHGGAAGGAAGGGAKSGSGGAPAGGGEKPATPPAQGLTPPTATPGPSSTGPSTTPPKK